jgi:hypothetical protein
VFPHDSKLAVLNGVNSLPTSRQLTTHDMSITSVSEIWGSHSVKMSTVVFQVVTPSLLGDYQRFEWMRRLHLQDRLKWSDTFLRNVGKLVEEYTKGHNRQHVHSFHEETWSIRSFGLGDFSVYTHHLLSWNSTEWKEGRTQIKKKIKIYKKTNHVSIVCKIKPHMDRAEFDLGRCRQSNAEQSIPRTCASNHEG